LPEAVVGVLERDDRFLVVKRAPSAWTPGRGACPPEPRVLGHVIERAFSTAQQVVNYPGGKVPALADRLSKLGWRGRG
jgi:hypothetical protein